VGPTLSDPSSTGTDAVLEGGALIISHRSIDPLGIEEWNSGWDIELGFFDSWHGGKKEGFPLWIGTEERYSTVVRPFWPTVVAGALTLFVWFPRRLIPIGCCRSCGYDLRGISAGQPCPECGTEPVLSTPP
jgi:hypothetical protein